MSYVWTSGRQRDAQLVRTGMPVRRAWYAIPFVITTAFQGERKQASVALQRGEERVPASVSWILRVHWTARHPVS
ncbi:hypothetical protein EGK76_08005 [Luteimonas sp. 100069]|nr:hypothetical protein EGK76_08005 [Luteimonas sp. 100069]